MDELFYKEEKICNFQESLSICTETYIYQLSEMDDDDLEGRNVLETTFTEHREKVEQLINKLVKSCL